MLQLLDISFYVIHVSIIVFSLFGWVIRRCRKAHLAFCGIIAASWFGLGIWRGWGYCPLTDWHWNVKEQLGVEGLPWSFIKHLWDNIMPFEISPTAADNLTFAAFLLAILIPVTLNFRKKQSGNAVLPSVPQTPNQTADP